MNLPWIHFWSAATCRRFQFKEHFSKEKRRQVAALQIVFALCALATSASAQPGYNFRGIAATIEESDFAFPTKGNWTGQFDIQTVTQTAYIDENANPFAYLQRVHLRPWKTYQGFKNTQLAGSRSGPSRP